MNYKATLQYIANIKLPGECILPEEQDLLQTAKETGQYDAESLSYQPYADTVAALLDETVSIARTALKNRRDFDSDYGETVAAIMHNIHQISYDDLYNAIGDKVGGFVGIFSICTDAAFAFVAASNHITQEDWSWWLDAIENYTHQIYTMALNNELRNHDELRTIAIHCINSAAQNHSNDKKPLITDTVSISVRGGVAEVEHAPMYINVEINDYDNEQH